jgi:hypothetical protein
MNTSHKQHSLRNLAATGVVGMSLLFGPSVLHAETSPGDDTSPTNTRDTTGVIIAYSPGVRITVKGQNAPYSYEVGRDMKTIGPDGKPLGAKKVHAGEKVTVYYYRRDGSPTVSRLVVLSTHPTRKS